MSSAPDIVTCRKRVLAASQRRNKPLIEKRRRARINECLVQLKQLLMKDMGTESPRATKLEKADILEMTVDYIKKVADKREGSARDGGGSKNCAPFVDGVRRCLEEVDTFLENQLDIKPEVRHKLSSHCRQQLCSLDVTVRSTSHEASSPSSPEVSSEKVVAMETSAEPADTKEPSLKALAEAEDSKTVLSPAHAQSATAYVAPFHYSTTVSPPEDGAAIPDSKKTGCEDVGLRFAGPLKLICGGNVFIVVDPQTQAKGQADSVRPTVATTTTSTATNTHYIYNPVSLLTPPPFTFLSTLPHTTVAPSHGQHSAHVTCSSGGGKVASFPIENSFAHVRQGTSPQGGSSPGVSSSAASDVNNNNILEVRQSLTTMWRPW
ncbi:transcription factor HES-4-like isoform X2 [Pomacea canaliculata]|uniref:transcription factor HES-4-like isoform X2 n=1 Tax=Pomacea canaliculata TaxID=400727 RepID=UPI000D72DF96|nr:transcription factor HES-4-like isoform X2 [Pomacea canaliculata]